MDFFLLHAITCLSEAEDVWSIGQRKNTEASYKGKSTSELLTERDGNQKFQGAFHSPSGCLRENTFLKKEQNEGKCHNH